LSNSLSISTLQLAFTETSSNSTADSAKAADGQTAAGLSSFDMARESPQSWSGVTGRNGLVPIELS
jgi:hypothetical protein